MQTELSSEAHFAVYATDAARWRAVQRRDRGADGAFVYAVRTTGVYCRPTCGARRPRRDNVEYYATCEAAEAAGYRPCKRCRPREASVAERQASMVAEACRRLEAAEEGSRLDELARGAGMSRWHFHRVFKRVTGLTPRAYAAARRAEATRDALRKSGTVTEALYGGGFNSSGRFYAASGELLGMAPKAFRDGGDGETIRFAVGECSLGSVLVAASVKGVCAIFLGDEPGQLVRELEDRFPKARLVGGDKTFEGWVARVLGLVERPGLGLDLPLDIRGTVFQRRVWEALRGIPAGSTASYAAVAARIGAPNAVRAVASACAANAIAVAIPCHRVVRTDGGVSGYRWGVERKRALLVRESKGQGR